MFAFWFWKFRKNVLHRTRPLVRLPLNRVIWNATWRLFNLEFIFWVTWLRFILFSLLVVIVLRYSTSNQFFFKWKFIKFATNIIYSTPFTYQVNELPLYLQLNKQVESLINLWLCPPRFFSQEFGQIRQAAQRRQYGHFLHGGRQLEGQCDRSRCAYSHGHMAWSHSHYTYCKKRLDREEYLITSFVKKIAKLFNENSWWFGAFQCFFDT